MRASILIGAAVMACANRTVEGVDSSDGGAQTETSTTSATTGVASGIGSTSTSTSSEPAPKHDLGASTKLDVDGPREPPFSCDLPPPPRALLACGSFEAPWGFALVQCIAPPASGCVPPDDAELLALFETCGECGGSLIDGPMRTGAIRRRSVLLLGRVRGRILPDGLSGPSLRVSAGSRAAAKNTSAIL